VEITAQWLQHPMPKFFFFAYPPGHFYLIGLASLIFRDVMVAGRIHPGTTYRFSLCRLEIGANALW
jgi:hypothetical protein